jgi:hypothetical protein
VILLGVELRPRRQHRLELFGDHHPQLRHHLFAVEPGGGEPLHRAPGDGRLVGEDLCGHHGANRHPAVTAGRVRRQGKVLLDQLDSIVLVLEVVFVDDVQHLRPEQPRQSLAIHASDDRSL